MTERGKGDAVSKVDVLADAPESPTSSQEPSCSDSKNRSKSIGDFLLLDELGEGSFSVVYKAKERETANYYAIKVILKKQIIKERKVEQVYRERDALAKLSQNEHRHPFFIQVYCTFQDVDSLYIVTTLAENGDLLMLLKKYKTFKICEARFYVSEIVVALGHMHHLGIIHRDLKPENILLSSSRHILMSDFGSSKLLYKQAGETQNRKRRSSFVGTAQYVSPEVLDGIDVQQACDYWALGVLMYQLVVGKHMFEEVSEYLLFRRILKADYKLPDNIPEAACDLIRNLVVLKPAGRLGSIERGGVDNVKCHPFFDDVDWENLHQAQPPSFER